MFVYTCISLTKRVLVQPMEVTYFPTLGILRRLFFEKISSGVVWHNVGATTNAKWKQNVVHEPIYKCCRNNVWNSHSRKILLGRYVQLHDFRSSSWPSLFFTSRRLFSSPGCASSSFTSSALNKKKTQIHRIQKTEEKMVVHALDPHPMDAHQNAEPKGCDKGTNRASPALPIGELYNVLCGKGNKTNTIQNTSPTLPLSPFPSPLPSPVHPRRQLRKTKHLRHPPPKRGSSIASILPSSSLPSSERSMDASRFSHGTFSTASTLVSSIVAIVEGDRNAPRSPCDGPTRKPVTPQEWYRHVTTHMKQVLSALEEASAFLSAPPTIAAHGVAEVHSLNPREKGRGVWSLDALVLHATHEVDALPEEVALPLSLLSQWNTSSSSRRSTTAEREANERNPHRTPPSWDRQRDSDAFSCTPFSQRIASHPPLFFAAILGSAWSCLLQEVWERWTRYDAHPYHATLVDSSSSLSRPSSASAFLHPSAVVAEEMGQETGRPPPPPPVSTPCPCRGCLSWQRLGQRVAFGMQAYHYLLQHLFLMPEGQLVGACVTAPYSAVSFANGDVVPPVSTSFGEAEAPPRPVTEKKRSNVHEEGWWKAEECALGWWSSVQLPWMHMALGHRRLLRHLYSTSSSFLPAAAARDRYECGVEAEFLISLQKACQSVGEHIQKKEMACVRQLMRWQDPAWCPHAAFSAVSSRPNVRSPAGHAPVASLERPRGHSLPPVRRSWSSFQRARAAASSLLRFLSLAREEEERCRGDASTASKEVRSMVPVRCILAMTRLLQRWESYEKEWMRRTADSTPLDDARYPLSPPSSPISPSLADSTFDAPATRKEGDAHAPAFPLSSSTSDPLAFSFSLHGAHRRRWDGRLHRLYAALRDEVLEQLEWLKAYAGYGVPSEGDDASLWSSGKPIPTRRRRRRRCTPPPIVHRTIHTSLNIRLAELCEDREKTVYPTPAGHPPDVWSEVPQQTTKGKAAGGSRDRFSTPLEIRAYLLFRLSALLRTTGEVHFSTPPEDGPSPSAGWPFSHSALVRRPSFSASVRPWVVGLLGRLVRICLEVEQDASFQGYMHFHLRPHTPLDPVTSFVAEEASIGPSPMEIRYVKSIQKWKTFLREGQSCQQGEATSLESWSLPPPAMQMGSGTASGVGGTPECHSFPFLCSADHHEETVNVEKEEKAKKSDVFTSWQEWYLPSVLLAYSLPLRCVTTQFIYYALVLWCTVNGGGDGECAALPAPASFRLPDSQGVSKATEDKEGEKDPLSAEETREGTEGIHPETKNTKKEREEAHERPMAAMERRETEKREYVMRIFIGTFENLWNALLRRQYLFGTQEKEVLSMWYEENIWMRDTPSECYSTPASSSRVPELGFAMGTPTLFSSSSSSLHSGSNGKKDDIDSKRVEREQRAADPNGGGEAYAEDVLLSCASSVSICSALHSIIASFSLHSCIKDVYRYWLKSFLWIREVSASSSTPSRGIGKKSCFTACGIRLSQAIEVSYFLFLSEQRWPHLLTPSNPIPTLSRHAFTLPMEKRNGRGDMEWEGNNEVGAWKMERDEAHDLPHGPSAIQEYGLEVFLRLEHSTAKQLWHLRSVARLPTKKSGDGLFYFTGEGQDRVYLQDPVLRLRHAQSILSVVHAHVVHPSLLWAPLWQVQELVAVFAFCRASPVRCAKKRAEKHHHPCGTSLLHSSSTTWENRVDSTVPHPDDDAPPVWQKNAEREEMSIQSVSLSERISTPPRAHAVGLEGEGLEEPCERETRRYRDDQEEDEEDPPAERTTVVVGSQQSNLSLFHGYIIMRIYVMSNVLRQWREFWVDALLVQKNLIEGVAPYDVSGDRPRDGFLLGEREREWSHSDVQAKLEALWRLEKLEPERERVARSSSEEESADPLTTATTSSRPFRRRRRTWAFEIVKDLMETSVPACVTEGLVDPTASEPIERTRCSSSRTGSSGLLHPRQKKGSSSPSPMPLRLLAARMEGTQDACWGAIRSIQRVEKMIQLMTRNKLFFHVLQDRHERWRQAEEEEEQKGALKDGPENETVYRQGREQRDTEEVYWEDGNDAADGVVPFFPSSSSSSFPFSSFCSNPSTPTSLVDPNEKPLPMRERIQLRIRRPDAVSPIGFVLSAGEGRILRVQERFQDGWEMTEGGRPQEGRILPSRRTLTNEKESDESKLEKEDEFLTPFAVAARKAGIESVHRLVEYYVCAVDNHEVENGKDVARMLKGKSFFTLRLEKTNNKNKKNTEM